MMIIIVLVLSNESKPEVKKETHTFPARLCINIITYFYSFSSTLLLKYQRRFF